MANYPLLHLSQTHPLLSGMGQGLNLFQEGLKTAYMPRTLKEELKKMQQFNQYYPEDIQSQIGNRNSHSRLQDQMAQWFGPTAQSHIDLINQGQIPNYQANTAHTGAETTGLDFTNKLNSRWQALEDAKADVNNMGPSPQGNKYNPYPESYNPTTVENIPATGPIAPLNNADKQAMQQNKIQQQAFDYLTKNNVEVTGPNLAKAIELASSQRLSQPQNPQMGNFDPNATLDQMANMGLATQNNPNMSRTPQPFVPVAQSLGMKQQGNQSPAQMPAQIPAQFDSNARLNQINQQQAAIAARLGKGRIGAETSEQKMAREENKENLKEEHAIKKEDRTVYRKLSENANKVAKDAKMMTTLVGQFEDAYGKTKFKGPVKGMVPGKLSDANARLADNAAMNMQSIAAKMLGASKLTNYELKFAGNLKLNREMGKEDTRVLADFMKAKTNRIEEEQRFLNNAKEKGLPPEKAQQLWNEYDNEKPVYDFENRKTNKQNLGRSNEYLNPNKEENKENIEDEQSFNGKRYVKINGEWHQA